MLHKISWLCRSWSWPGWPRGSLASGRGWSNRPYLDELKKLTNDQQRAKVASDLDAIEQHKNDARLKEEEKRRKEEAKEQHLKRRKELWEERQASSSGQTLPTGGGRP